MVSEGTRTDILLLFIYSYRNLENHQVIDHLQLPLVFFHVLDLLIIPCVCNIQLWDPNMSRSCKPGARHSNRRKCHSESSMIRERVVFRPHPLFHFRRKKNSIFHPQTNAVLCAIFYIFPRLIVYIISIMRQCRIPYPQLQG